MPVASLDGVLARLDEVKRCFGPRDAARAEKLLAMLGRRRFGDAAGLTRFHEILLFLRAYPHSAEVLRRADEILLSFGRRVAQLGLDDGDLSPLREPEVCGIAGTSFAAVFTYDVIRKLMQLRAKLNLVWESYETPERLSGPLSHFVPLLEEDSLVEANVPYLAWMRSAQRSSGSDLRWLLKRWEEWQLPDKQKAQLFDLLGLPVEWNLGSSDATRSRMRLPIRKVFYHDAPLIRRSEVSLATELESPPLPMKRISRAKGAAVLNMALLTSAVRYRELYGFTYGDPAHGIQADAGRGVEIFIFGLPPERRLPLRAYHTGLIFKNGVPAGYVETLTLFERIEVGFNLYYTFREGESAWLYARVLRLFRQLLGVTCFSVDPYQIGFHNEEAIESGAFWFYRKLGFHSTMPGLQKVAEAEEKKIQANPNYRTGARTLRRLSERHMIYDATRGGTSDWDGFQVRRLCLALERRGGLHRILSLVPDILRAKAGPDETEYVRLLQDNQKLRAAILKLGTK